MATTHQWKARERRSDNNQFIDEVTSVTRASMLEKGYDNETIDMVCSANRIKMRTFTQEKVRESRENRLPLEFASLECDFYIHTVLLRTLRYFGVMAVDNGESVLSRTDFFKKYSLVDARKMDDCMLDELASRLELLAEDIYAMDDKTLSIFEEDEVRITG